MDAKTFAVVEVVSNKISCELGDWAEYRVDTRGTTLATLRKQPRLMFDSQVKHCLANLVPGLPEATTIVHIPDVTQRGERLDMSEWTQAFWFAANKYGVPMWTQSSIKAKTFYFIRPEMFSRLASKWNLAEDGPKFTAYGGLLFSETDGSEPVTIKLDGIAKPSDGQDGNCAASLNWGKNSCQFRLMQLDGDGLPTALGKGIAVPVKNVEGVQLNDTQIKWGGPGEFVLLKNKYVSAKPLKMWISAEPIVMLQDVPPVRRFLSARVNRQVSECLNYLTEKNRVGLLKWLGGLDLAENGALESAKRAVIEALRSKLPWCKELEDRITRFLIRLVCESIIPSGGIQGFASLLVVSDKHGVGPCDWKDAKHVGFRIPVTGSNAIIPLPKDPFVRGKGMVVTPKVAKLASGDADGDLFVVVSDKEVVELFRHYLNHELVSGLKPAKTRTKAALTAESVQDAAIDQVANAWMVGALTVAGWKMAQIGSFKAASELLDLANIEPMTYKWSIEFEGKKFAAYAMDLYAQLRDELKAITLQWREKAAESRSWSSPREMVEAGIGTPASHLDVCWNAGVEAAKKWAEGNPLQPLSLSKVARIAFGENGIVIPGSAWREARELISWWGKYWSAAHEDGNMDGDHGAAYHHAAEWAKSASREAIAALLVWRPKNPENNGFSLKWHAVFAGGRATDVLGFHPSVQAALVELNQTRKGIERQLALVEALLEAIQ